MSVMKRVKDITVATLHEYMEKSEDPIGVIDGFLSRQKHQLRNLEQLLYQTKSHAENLRLQYVQAEVMAEKRGEQAEWAVKAGEEHAARIALQEKIQQQEKSEQYRELYESTQDTVQQLEQQVMELREEYQSVLDKREYYLARIRSAQLQQRWNRQSQQHGMDSGWFHRLEDQVENLEHETRAWGDMRRESRAASYTSMKMASRVDSELEQLRMKMKERREQQ
ncbi:PspA/IM30 family protein [Marinicrinis sediminis]|uniref:PspA/IM30 family protein n=1 Tax=Marinicrinis sediminis TaxID=1652465 RepID=A0ABW5RCW7_9BACL